MENQQDTSANAGHVEAAGRKAVLVKGDIQGEAHCRHIINTTSVNAIAPGPVWTPLMPSIIPEHEEFGKDRPMQRAGQPAEIAPAYVFLASRDASYIAGATIPLPEAGLLFNDIRGDVNNSKCKY